MKNKGTHYLSNPNGSIALYYRWENIKYNDGTVEPQLQYLSTCGGGWIGTTERDPEKFAKEKLIEL